MLPEALLFFLCTSMKNILLLLAFLLCSAAGFAQKNTAKADDEDKAYKFLVIGDWGRNGQYNQQDVADAMGKYNRNFDGKCVLSMGDNFYCCGVASADDPQWMSSFENVYKDHSLQIDWYPVIGNHDYHGNVQAEIDYSKKSRRWVLPARYHTLVKKIGSGSSVRFVFLDTDPFIDKYIKNASSYGDIATQSWQKELQWLDSVLASSKETWKIVCGHHPVYSTGGEHGDQPELIERLKPVLEKYHVDIYFAGHEHDLQHQKPDGSSVNYFISGAGSEVRPSGPKKAMTKFSSATAGFMAVSLTATTCSVEAIDQKGKSIYSTTIKK